MPHLRWSRLLCVCAMWLASSPLHGDGRKVSAEKKEPTLKQQKIAEAIGKGHAYEKHVLVEKQFPECKTQADFVKLIARVIANPTHHKDLENDRAAYYDNKSNTIVIYNPFAKDRGTCFRPRARLRYYNNLK